MNLSELLYESVKDIWDSYYTHPFVAEMANGTLGKDQFRYYMIQDYLYLLKYAKVFALGIAKSEDEALMRKFSQSVHTILNGEMSIHKSYMERLGITAEEIKNAKMSLNLGFPSLVLTTSSSKG